MNCYEGPSLVDDLTGSNGTSVRRSTHNTVWVPFKLWTYDFRVMLQNNQSETLLPCSACETLLRNVESSDPVTIALLGLRGYNNECLSIESPVDGNATEVSSDVNIQ